jgi:hypothetical protein
MKRGNFMDILFGLVFLISIPVVLVFFLLSVIRKMTNSDRLKETRKKLLISFIVMALSLTFMTMFSDDSSTSNSTNDSTYKETVTEEATEAVAEEVTEAPTEEVTQQDAVQETTTTTPPTDEDLRKLKNAICGHTWEISGNNIGGGDLYRFGWDDRGLYQTGSEVRAFAFTVEVVDGTTGVKLVFDDDTDNPVYATAIMVESQDDAILFNPLWVARRSGWLKGVSTSIDDTQVKKARLDKFAESCNYSLYTDQFGSRIFELSFVNTFGKEIKYITFEYDYVNRVGDVTNSASVKITGPIGNGETFSGSNDCTLDVDESVSTVKFTGIKIIYTDNSTENFEI